MASASITITDQPDGTIKITASYGEAIDESSQAQSVVSVLLESVLGMAKTYQAIEDTATSVKVEPSRIILPGQ